LNFEKLVSWWDSRSLCVEHKYKKEEKSMKRYTSAKKILGKDFISPEMITDACGVTYTDHRLDEIYKTLPSHECLVWCRDNNATLTVGPQRSLSLLGVRNVNNEHFHFTEGGWYSERDEAFARYDKIRPGWIALRKEPVADSFHKDWPNQNGLVIAPTVVPNAAEVAWVILVHVCVRGDFLFKNVWVRTSSVDHAGNHVGIGVAPCMGIVLTCDWDEDDSLPDLGIAEARKKF